MRQGGIVMSIILLGNQVRIHVRPNIIELALNIEVLEPKQIEGFVTYLKRPFVGPPTPLNSCVGRIHPVLKICLDFPDFKFINHHLTIKNMIPEKGYFTVQAHQSIVG